MGILELRGQLLLEGEHGLNPLSCMVEQQQLVKASMLRISTSTPAQPAKCIPIHHHLSMRDRVQVDTKCSRREEMTSVTTLLPALQSSQCVLEGEGVDTVFTR